MAFAGSCSALARWAIVVAVTTSVGCGARTDNSHVSLPEPTEATTVGAGDTFTMQVVGEKEMPTSYAIDSNGDVDLPYLHRVHVEGLMPQEIADLIAKRYIEAKILSDPSIIIRVDQYQSKHLIILGQVMHPGRFSYSAGITLIQAISLAGGFSGAAKTDRVSLTRKTRAGTRTVILSADAITDGRSNDIPLQADDQIFVPQRVF